MKISLLNNQFWLKENEADGKKPKYLVILGVDGAARRKLCAGRLWGFWDWSSFTGDSKRCLLVTVQSNNAPSFVDHMLHAVLF